MIQGWGMTETSPGGGGLPAEDAERKLGSAGSRSCIQKLK